MTVWLRLAAPVGLVFIAVAAVASAPAAPQAPQDPPRFRTGVDLTRLELVVLDKNTRKPIRGLTADDFVVKVSGDVQPIATLAEVDVPSAAAHAAAGIVEAAHDVAVNDRRSPRLFVILLNDAAGGNDPFDMHTGIAIAHRVIDGLGPDDRAAVVFTRDNRHAQDLTADRTLLRRAAERFKPMDTAGINWLTVLRRAQAFLIETPGYQRALVLISPVASGPVGRFNPFGIDEYAEAGVRDLSAIASTARIGHVPIYMFSTHGLHAPTAADMRTGGRNGAYEGHVEVFRTIAGLTGGRAIVAHNKPTDRVAAVFDELSSYYALAFENTHPPDGRRRWLDVDVRRPDAMVMPGRVLITMAKAATPRATGTAAREPRESGLLEALTGAVPTGDLRLRLSSLPIGVPDQRDQALALTLALPGAREGAAESYRVQLMVFDGEGRRELLTETHDIAVAGGEPAGGEWTDVSFRLNLRPGRYQLRMAAEARTAKTAGSVYATAIIPDFSRDPLSLSGVAIGRADGRARGGQETLAGLLPFAPTAVRAFAASDRVGALLRVHQSPRTAAADVVLDTEIVDGAGVIVHEAERLIAAEAFQSGAGVPHRFELPLADLAPGDYLLRFVATAGKSRIQRDVRFSVQPRLREQS